MCWIYHVTDISREQRYSHESHRSYVFSAVSKVPLSMRQFHSWSVITTRLNCLHVNSKYIPMQIPNRSRKRYRKRMSLLKLVSVWARVFHTMGSRAELRPFPYVEKLKVDI